MKVTEVRARDTRQTKNDSCGSAERDHDVSFNLHYRIITAATYPFSFPNMIFKIWQSCTRHLNQPAALITNANVGGLYY